jgi:hypothetical protein
MLNGKCPSCGAATVHAKEGGILPNVVRISTFGLTIKPIDYVCGTCGYWERRIPPGHVLRKIQAKWPLVQVRSQQQPSGEPHDAGSGGN